MIIYSQGTIVPPGKIIYTPRVGCEADIYNIKINNIGLIPYTISVFRYIKGVEAKILLYKLTLDGGDIVDDDTHYYIQYQDYISVETTSTDVNFVINGIENLIG